MKMRDKKTRAALLVKKFSCQTTLHGFRHMVGGLKDNCRTDTWRIVFGFSLVAVAVGIYHVSFQFLQEPTYVVSSQKFYEDGPDIDPSFPQKVRITICRMPPWTKLNAASDEDNRLYAYTNKFGFTALGYPFHSLTEDQADYLLNNETKVNSNNNSTSDIYFEESRINYFNLTESLYNESSFINVRSMRCKEFIDHWENREIAHFESILTTRGRCCTTLFGDSGSARKELVYPENQTDGEPEGFAILVSYPLEHTSYLHSDSFVFLPPGYFLRLNIMLVMTKRDALYSSWYKQSADCPSLSENIEPNGTMQKFYGIESCTQRHILNHTERLCGCISVLGSGTYDQRLCSPDDILDGFKDWVESHTGEEKVRRRRSCQHPCVEYSYDLQWTLTELGGKSTLSMMSYSYQKDYFRLKEYRNLSLNAVLSQLGGVLGLYLGASIITIIEFFGFLSKLIWFSVTPSAKRRSVVSQARMQKLEPKCLVKLNKQQYLRRW